MVKGVTYTKIQSSFFDERKEISPGSVVLDKNNNQWTKMKEIKSSSSTVSLVSKGVFNSNTIKKEETVIKIET